RCVFVFPGQGHQWHGMAAGLLSTSPVFAERIAACDTALRPHTDWSLLEVLSGAEGAPDLERADVVQVALWATMIGLDAMWRAVGVEPAGVVGHSLGEVAAAHVAGVLTLEESARVIAVRAGLFHEHLQGRGGMVTVALPREQAEALTAEV